MTDHAFHLLVAGGADAAGHLLPKVCAVYHRRTGRALVTTPIHGYAAAQAAPVLPPADALLWLPAAGAMQIHPAVHAACRVDCPIVAAPAARAEPLLGEAGLLPETVDPDTLALAIDAIDTCPELRRRLLRAQRHYAGIACDTRAIAPLHLQGPSAGSYSLARVNRLLASALTAAGAHCQLVPDGLSHHPQGERTLIALQNTWPPDPDALRAPTCALAAWAWEETALPAAQVERMNARLNLVTTVSDWVSDVLRANGVTAPVETIGLGTEHTLAVPSAALPPLPPGDCRFLHISSCLPRKGVDLLLAAWVRAFTDGDDVCLILKATANPHHDIIAQVDAWRAAHRGAAPVAVYCDDWSDGRLRALYEACDVLVAPSRGEGFGLPLAEAMHHGLAVITTGHGGQRSFCTDETAWLVDYRFAQAASHMDLHGSAWVEPDVDHLVERMREVRALATAARRRVAERGAELLRSRYTWPATAERLLAALTRHDRAPLVLPRLRMAWISTWATRCGIAEYSRHLLSHLGAVDTTVLAARRDESAPEDPPGVRRCWRADRQDDLTGLQAALDADSPEIVVVQVSFAWFAPTALERLLSRHADTGTPVVAMLHATAGEPGADLIEYVPALRHASRILVHAVADLERLRQHELATRATVLPHGVGQPLAETHEPGSSHADAGPVIASFGFLLPHKGVPALIDAFGLLQADHPGARLLLLNALHPDPESSREAERCRERIAALTDPAAVRFETGFLPAADIERQLRTADVVVLPYQHTTESASGAVRQALAVDRPILCSPLPIFDDLGPAVHRLEGLDPVAIARGIDDLLADHDRQRALAAARHEWCAQHAWPRIGARLRGLLHNVARPTPAFGEGA